MNCPICKKPMRKVRWGITNNGASSDPYIEFERSTYECKSDSTWVITEPPMLNEPINPSKKQ